MTDRWLSAWGKFDRATGRTHRIEHHCADVAAVFEALLEDRVLRERFRVAAGGALPAITIERLTVLAFLHDFGKLNSLFQFKVRDPAFHAGHTTEAIQCCHVRELHELLGLREIRTRWGKASDALFRAMLAHHGRPANEPRAPGGGNPELWQPRGGYDPRAAAALLGERARAWFPTAFAAGPDLPEDPRFAHQFAGALALADHFGSDEKLFRFESEPDPAYIGRAREVAAKAVTSGKLRRGAWAAATTAPTVAHLFGHPTPRPAQRAVMNAPLDTPLLILESETGSGKTEAAVLRFAALMRAGRVDGLYFAVPTRAAAKQLHGRVEKALRRFMPEEIGAATVLAVPGCLRVNDKDGSRIGRFEVWWEDAPGRDAALGRWSAEASRKFLSAPAAVGTVDQVLLAGLRVKWAHMRGASASRNLLVIDEVHASDAYMTKLLHGFLRDHLAVGGHALLMSATLGAAARSRFVSDRERADCPPLAEATATPYPALTLAVGGAHRTERIGNTGNPETGKTVSVAAERMLGNPDAIAARAVAAAHAGARVLVIRNTVTSAQAVFDAARRRGADGVLLQVEGVSTLHHSRFSAEDRHRLDDAVEAALGKGAPRARGALVIGTQTLEQSLDVDADLLVTDLCPVDVLLQRIGRLHRHAGTNRPAGFETPRCRVLAPEHGLEAGLKGSLLRHGLGQAQDGGGVYIDLVSLQATSDLIERMPTWRIPAMNRMLVERATHPEALEALARRLGPEWRRHKLSVDGKQGADRSHARRNRLDRTAKFDHQLSFPADSEERIRTRLGEDGPRVELAEPVVGPFGLPVQTFNLPAHLFRKDFPTGEQIEAAAAQPAPAFRLTVGSHVFEYDRAGIRRAG